MPYAPSPAYPGRISHFAPIECPYGDLCVRPITPDDAVLAQEFVSGLSPASRYFRFFQVMTKLSPSLMERFLASDGQTHLALIALAHIEGQPRIVGEARYIAAKDGFAAEFAVAISDQWHRLGIARGLIERLESCAVKSGVRNLCGETLPNNEALIAFARTSGFRVWSDVQDRNVLRLAKNIAV